MISLIAAQAEDGAIGRQGGLPWHISGDMKRFSALTSHHTILMGRKTFESLPKVLPHRRHLVVTRDLAYHVADERVSIVHDLDAVLPELSQSQEEIFVIGGASVYRQCLPYADRVYLTLVHTTVPDADTFLSLSLSDFCITAKEGPFCDDPDDPSSLSYEFIDYERRVPGAAQPAHPAKTLKEAEKADEP